MVETRSFAAAVYLMALGFKPEVIDPALPVCTFPDDAAEPFRKYRQSARRLGVMLEDLQNGTGR
jgi:hypothetical protein